MKRSSIILIIFILSIIIYLYINVYGWFEFRRNSDTPKKYLNHSKNSKNNYTKDSLWITVQLCGYLKNHQESFYVKNYFEDTELMIDTILYSPDKDKIALFVIVKKPTYRKLIASDKYEYYYDGYCYFGLREKDIFHLYWYENSLTNFSAKSDISSALRGFYFREFASIKTRDTGLVYNLNDIRFWNCNFWNTVEEKINKKVEFENERKRNPANIYIPSQQ
jgi:hypothetical protein